MKGAPFSSVFDLGKNLFSPPLYLEGFQAFSLLKCCAIQAPSDLATTVSAYPLTVDIYVNVEIKTTMHIYR